MHLALASLLVLVAACSTSTEVDAGLDGSTDGGDAGSDASPDGGGDCTRTGCPAGATCMPCLGATGVVYACVGAGAAC